MTTREKYALLGERRLLAIRGQELWAEVEIVDIRSEWGRTRFLVKAIAGLGEAWVDEGSLRPVS